MGSILFVSIGILLVFDAVIMIVSLRCGIFLLCMSLCFLVVLVWVADVKDGFVYW